MSGIDPDDQRAVMRKKVLARAFSGLTDDEVDRLYADLEAGGVTFGTGDFILRKRSQRATADEEALNKWLDGMGVWKERLHAAIFDETHTLRWSAEHKFLYILGA